MEKGDPSYIVGGNAGWCSHSGNVWRSLKKLTIKVTSYPAFALLGIYPKDTDVVKRRAAYTPVFIAALSTVAKLWKEPRCPSTDDWIKMWSIYTIEYYSVIRNDEYLKCTSRWI